MAKKSSISVISQEEKKKGGLLNIKYSVLPIKYRGLLHSYNCKKHYLSQRAIANSGKRQRLLTYLSKKNKLRYKELTDRLDIREPKTH
nr:ribosomal protein S15 [Pteridophyllum racemosum]